MMALFTNSLVAHADAQADVCAQLHEANSEAVDLLRNSVSSIIERLRRVDPLEPERSTAPTASNSSTVAPPIFAAAPAVFDEPVAAAPAVFEAPAESTPVVVDETVATEPDVVEEPAILPAPDPLEASDTEDSPDLVENDAQELSEITTGPDDVVFAPALALYEQRSSSEWSAEDEERFISWLGASDEMVASHKDDSGWEEGSAGVVQRIRERLALLVS